MKTAKEWTKKFVFSLPIRNFEKFTEQVQEDAVSNRYPEKPPEPPMPTGKYAKTPKGKHHTS